VWAANKENAAENIVPGAWNRFQFSLAGVHFAAGDGDHYEAWLLGVSPCPSIRTPSLRIPVVLLISGRLFLAENPLGRIRGDKLPRPTNWFESTSPSWRVAELTGKPSAGSQLLEQIAPESWRVSSDHLFPLKETSELHFSWKSIFWLYLQDESLINLFDGRPD
jgi:hypothetical protein